MLVNVMLQDGRKASFRSEDVALMLQEENGCQVTLDLKSQAVPVSVAHSIEIMELKVKGLAIPQALEEAARKPAPAKKSAAREPVGKKGA